MNLSGKQIKLFTLLIVAPTLLAFTRLSLVGIIIAILAWAWVSSKVIKKRFYLGALSHFFLGFLLFCCINMLIAITAWFANVSVPLAAITFVNGALAAAIYLLLQKKQPDNDPDEPTGNHRVAVTACLLIIASFSLPFFVRLNTASLINYTVTGYDEGSHVQLYRTDVETKGFFYHNADETRPRISVGLAGYPQGFHFNVSVIGRGILAMANTTTNNIRMLLFGYRVGTAAFYAAIVALTAEAMAQLVGLLTKRQKLGLVAELSISATILIVYAALMFPQIMYTGQSFLSNVAMFAGLLAVLLAFKRTASGYARYIMYGFACLLAIAVTYCWLISALASFSALAIAALGENPKETLLAHVVKFLHPNKKFSFKEFMVQHWTWVFIAVSGLLAIPQVLVQLKFAFAGAAYLNTDGGITSPDHSRYLVLCLAGLLTLLVGAGLKKGPFADKKFSDFGLLFFSSFVIVLFFYLYQTVTTGQLTYYYTKSSYMAYIFALPFVVGLLTYLLVQAEKQLKLVKTLCFTAVVFGILAIYLSVGRSFLLYTKGAHFYVDNRVSVQAAKLMDSGVKPMRIVSYTQRIYEEDMLFDHFSGQLDQFTPMTRRTMDLDIQMKNYDHFKQTLKAYIAQSHDTVYILASTQTNKELHQVLPATGNYKIIVVEK